MKIFIKWLLNGAYVLIFHYDKMFHTGSYGNIGEYIPTSIEDMYVLTVHQNKSLVIFKKYLLWK